VVSLFVPVVVAYIIYAWGALEKKKLRLDDLENDGHTY
jgi:cytochrome d ubiquinol oxidase subunit II